MEMKHRLPDLPHELIIQILLRLPVKSLIRFKCVCKSWFSIISIPILQIPNFNFNAATHTHRALLVANGRPRSIDLELSIDDDSAYVSLNPPNFMPAGPYSFVRIKGSCRGFILFLYGFSSFYLWNPSTGLEKNIKVYYYFCGFGYDQSSDDYLVVLMSSGTSSYLEFFSLRTNKWKQIDEGTHIQYTNTTQEEAGSLFNGAIHWFAYRDLEKYVIVAFDLIERKLIDMNLPDEFDNERSYFRLWVFRGFLSLWTMDRNGIVEIWVMKEYKLHSSWTKTHVLPTDAIFNYISPLTSTKSGDIVGADDYTGLVKYNDEGQLLGHHSYCNDRYGSKVVMYIESLLSLPGDNVQA